MYLLVLGFMHPDLQDEIRSELDRLGDNALAQVIDALGVHKGVEVEVLHNSQLGADQQAAFGALVGGLIGLGAAGEEGFELGPSAAPNVAERGRAGSGWPRSSSAPQPVAIGLVEAEAMVSGRGDAL
jgi:hypothetical protein